MKNIFLFIITLSVWSLGFSQQTLKIDAGHLVVNGSTNIVLANTQWVNNGNFDAGTGTVHIVGDNGSAQRDIGGSSITTFYNLKFLYPGNNSQLQQMIQIDNELQMTTGDLDLNNNNILLNGSIIGESASSYVHGPAGGEIIKTVDLDAPTDENPGNIGVAITSSANLITTTIYRGHVAQDVNGEQSIERYYDIVVENNSGLDATLQLYYFDHELNGIAEDDLAPFEHNGIAWTEYPANDANQTTNYVEAIDIDELYFWTLAEMVAPLPIELLYFRGKLQENNEILLDWVTISEQNNKGFEVQRMNTSGDWEQIGWVDGFGTTNEEQRYDFTDHNPLIGLNYYRLKQIDFDGTFEYSNVVAIEVETRVTDFEVFPNPTSGVINFSESLKGKLIVRDMLGKIVWQNRQNGNIQNVDLSHLSSGSYLLEYLDQNEILQTTKIIISKN